MSQPHRMLKLLTSNSMPMNPQHNINSSLMNMSRASVSITSSFDGLPTSYTRSKSNSFFDDDESEFKFESSRHNYTGSSRNPPQHMHHSSLPIPYSIEEIDTNPPAQQMHPSSLPIPCPNADRNIEEREAEECQTEIYNRATWNMYNR